MKQRRSKRVAVRLPAKMVSEGNAYAGFIENCSREGILKIIPHERLLNFLPGTTHEVRFQTPSGEMLNLYCEIRWLRFQTNMPFGLNHYVGMEIINPPRIYSEFVQNLYDGHVSGDTYGNGLI